MIVLLAIGEALLVQARDEKLVGGGEITVLPEGLDVEVMKTGGVGGLFFSIDNARFIYRQLLASPRLDGMVTAVAPQVTGKLLYVRKGVGSGAREYPVRATGEVPSRSAAVGAKGEVVRGEWRDDDGDREWVDPTPYELYSYVDHFHITPEGVGNPGSWGEWHYFNVLSADRKRWAFISFIVAGDVRGREWGGVVAVSLREEGGRTRRFEGRVGAKDVRFSTETPDVTMGRSSVRLLPDGKYRVHAVGKEKGGSGELVVDLVVTPAAGAMFPGTTLASGEFTSGYAVPVLRGVASGKICVSGECDTYDGVQAYHDHNWGVWQGVRWEWGEARAGEYTILYGRVEAPDSGSGSVGGGAAYFLYLVDSVGFRGLFRPKEIQYVDGRVIRVSGEEVRVPSRAVLSDVRGGDTLVVELSGECAEICVESGRRAG
jgi:hypothetical protein